MYGTENLILSSPVMWIFFVLTAISSFLEYKLSCKWLWIVLGAVLQAAAVITLLFVRAALLDALLYILGVVLIRLCFVMLERRRAG